MVNEPLLMRFEVKIAPVAAERSYYCALRSTEWETCPNMLTSPILPIQPMFGLQTNFKNIRSKNNFQIKKMKKFEKHVQTEFISFIFFKHSFFVIRYFFSGKNKVFLLFFSRDLSSVYTTNCWRCCSSWTVNIEWTELTVLAGANISKNSWWLLLTHSRYEQKSNLNSPASSKILLQLKSHCERN